MSTTVERTHATDPGLRYEAVLALRQEPSATAAARLVELLADTTEVCVDEGCSIYDVDPTYRPVCFAARETLPAMGEFLWPAIAGAWPTATKGTRGDMLSALRYLSLDVRATLLERLVATNESMSLEGSLRKWLCQLLGDAAQIEAELGPRLEEMARSTDPVVVERARQLRNGFAVARRGA